MDDFDKLKAQKNAIVAKRDSQTTTPIVKHHDSGMPVVCAHAISYPMVWHRRNNRTRCTCAGVIDVNGTVYCRRHAGVVLIELMAGKAP